MTDFLKTEAASYAKALVNVILAYGKIPAAVTPKLLLNKIEAIDALSEEETEAARVLIRDLERYWLKAAS